MCYNDIKKDELVWKLFTIKYKDELDTYVENEKMLNNYSKRLKRLSKDKEYCRMVWDERIEKALRNYELYQNGKTEGEDIGALQKQNEMIINFYNNGVSLELISKSSGLTIDEVKEIIEKNNAKDEMLDNDN